MSSLPSCDILLSDYPGSAQGPPAEQYIQHLLKWVLNC